MSAPAMALTAGPGSNTIPLPRELRDYIYQYLLTTTFTVLNPRTGDAPSSLPLHRNTRLAILSVSKSTHEEARRLLYKDGRFRFNAMSAGSPPLHEVIGQIPDIGMLQDITLYLDAGLAASLGYHKHSLVRFAPTLIRCFAGLESSVPRQRFVVEIMFDSDFDFVVGLLDMITNVGKGMGRLTGFRTVELRMGYLLMTMGPVEFLVPLYTLLNENLAMTLGDGKLVHDEENFCWTYRPRKVSEVVAAPRERHMRAR